MSTQPHIDNGLKTLISSFDQIFLQNSDQPAKEVTPFREAFCNTEFDDDEVEDIINDWITSFINSVYIIENLKSLNHFRLSETKSFSNIVSIAQKVADYRAKEKGKSSLVMAQVKGLHYDIQDLKKEIQKVKDENQRSKDKAEAPVEFKYVENTFEDVGPKLDHYLKVAAAFKTNLYNGSIASKIDDLIENLNRCSRNDTNDSDGDNCQMSFVAVAAPSLVGKTQLSFMLNHRSLYFPLSQVDSPTPIIPQSIYLNFESLNQFIFRCSESDLQIILNILGLNGSMPNYEKTVYEKLSANNLKAKFFDQKFKVLGLLLALVEDAEHHYDNLDKKNQPAWMYYHAKRRNMIINPVSIKTIRENLARFERYFVFLDEFFASFNNVYVKNIVRAAGLTCFVANTTTAVADLINQNVSQKRRGDDLVVWAHVITKLDLSSYAVLSQISEVDRDFNEILAKMQGEEKNMFSLFFRSCIINNFKDISPGMGDFIASALKKLKSEANLSALKAVDCVNFIFKHGYNELVKRKNNIVTTIEGRIANLALLSSIAYENSDIESVFRPEEWMFKLVLTQFDDSPLRVRRQMADKIDLTTQWAEVSFFRDRDFFTALLCMFGGINRTTVSKLMENDMFKTLSNSLASRFANPKAKSNDGLTFEVMCSISIVDSSHYVFEKIQHNENVSLSGVNFIEFLKNMIRNLSLSESAAKPDVSFFMEKPESRNYFDLENYLQNYHVPFLNATNRKWPACLSGIFRLNDPMSSLKLGAFERTANYDQVEARFDILHQERNDVLNIFNAFVECIDQTITAEDLIQILKKTLLHIESKFTLIFCNHVGGHHKDLTGDTPRIQELIEYLKVEKINMYRFELTIENSQATSAKNSDSVFHIVPFRAEAPICVNPRMVVFIFDISSVNSENKCRNVKKMNVFKKRKLNKN